MSIGTVKDIRRMQVERIRAKLMDDDQLSRNGSRRWTDAEIRVVFEEIDHLKSDFQAQNKDESVVSMEEIRNFAGEFLRLSIGSLEWEQLRSVARDILKRTGGNR
jgi:hypothetical protein